MEIGIISRFWFCWRPGRFKINIRWNLMHFRKSHVRAKRLDVPETDFSFTQCHWIWSCFFRCRFAHGWYSSIWSMGFNCSSITFFLKSTQSTGQPVARYEDRTPCRTHIFCGAHLIPDHLKHLPLAPGSDGSSSGCVAPSRILTVIHSQHVSWPLLDVPDPFPRLCSTPPSTSQTPLLVTGVSSEHTPINFTSRRNTFNTDCHDLTTTVAASEKPDKKDVGQSTSPLVSGARRKQALASNKHHQVW